MTTNTETVFTAKNKAGSIHGIIDCDINSRSMNTRSSFASCDLQENDSEIVVTAISQTKETLEKKYNRFGVMLIRVFREFLKMGNEIAGFDGVIANEGDHYKVTWTFEK